MTTTQNLGSLLGLFSDHRSAVVKPKAFCKPWSPQEVMKIPGGLTLATKARKDREIPLMSQNKRDKKDYKCFSETK